MSNIVRSPDGKLSLSSKVLNKYSHYQYLRVSATGGYPDGKVKAILQGYNGKKWVRARALPGWKNGFDEEERVIHPQCHCSLEPAELEEKPL